MRHRFFCVFPSNSLFKPCFNSEAANGSQKSTILRVYSRKSSNFTRVGLVLCLGREYVDTCRNQCNATFTRYQGNPSFNVGSAFFWQKWCKQANLVCFYCAFCLLIQVLQSLRNDLRAEKKKSKLTDHLRRKPYRTLCFPKPLRIDQSLKRCTLLKWRIAENALSYCPIMHSKGPLRCFL